MDVGSFWPFENIYNHVCHKYIRMSQPKVVSKYEVCELGCKEYVKALQQENLQSSFRRTGIYPFNPNIIDRSVFLPSTVFENIKEVKDENVKEAKDNETEEAGKNMQLKLEKSKGIKIVNEAPETGNETALKFFERREDGIFVRKETKKHTIFYGSFYIIRNKC